MGAASLGPLAPLADFPQFIVVLLVPRPTGKTEKLPLDYRTATVADAHDPQHWTTYENASALAAAWGSLFGVGFVLTTADPFIVVDIDDGAMPSGEWSPLALELCAALPGAVVEVSQSGRGLHLWAKRQPLPAHSAKNVALHIEAYSSRRFILLGSNAVGSMADDCPHIDALLAHYFPPRTAAVDVSDDGPCEGWSGPEDDDELIELARRSRSAANVFGDGGVTFNDLWDSNAEALARKWPGNGRAFDASSADFALAVRLAFFTGRDVARIERLMQRSALRRDKWETHPSYLVEFTIRRACAAQGEVYRGKAPAAEATQTDAAPHKPARYALLPDEPLNAARAYIQRHHDHPEGARLKAWQSTFYTWGGACWRELDPPDVRARLYDFLDREGFSHYRPTQSKVTGLLDALKAAAHLDSTHAAPCWIRGNATAPAGELVACANGLLHLPSRAMLPATPRFFNLNAVPFNYEPSAALPTHWLRFLAEVWPNDPEAISTLQELFGYLLTPDTSQQKVFLIVGPKRSGKGTIARVLTELLGHDNVAGPTLASMAETFGLHPLVGKLAAIISDARLSGRTDQKGVAENLLRISGEDRIEIGRKFLPAMTARLGVRFVMLTNELPRIADASGAMASRFVILTMTESFFGREDPGLTAKLLTELPGVLVWAVEGWHRLHARGHFIEPKSSTGAAQELADLGSPIGAFVREECRCAPAAEIEVGELFNAWRTWCARQGNNHPGTAQVFGRDLRAAFPSITDARPRTAGERVRVYRGIALHGPQWSAVRSIAA